MNALLFDDAKIDIINYLSIDALEKIGIIDPPERMIQSMEKLLRYSAEQDLGINKYKRFEVIK